MLAIRHTPIIWCLGFAQWTILCCTSLNVGCWHHSIMITKQSRLFWLPCSLWKMFYQFRGGSSQFMAISPIGIHCSRLLMSCWCGYYYWHHCIVLLILMIFWRLDYWKSKNEACRLYIAILTLFSCIFCNVILVNHFIAPIKLDVVSHQKELV